VKSTVDYILVWQEDKAKIRNVKVIASEECVPKHKLLVMDMWFKATKRRRRKFDPRVRVWKLEEKTCEEFRCMVGDKVEEVNWKGLGVNDHWQQTDNHASTPPLSFLQAGCPSCRPTNSVKALKANCL